MPQRIIAGLGRSNGTEWDGNGSIPQADIAEAATALATQNYAAMAAMAVGWAQQGWGAPDMILSAFEARDAYAVKSAAPNENTLPDILDVRIKVDEFTGGAGETGGADGAGGMAPPPNGGTLPPEGGTLPPNGETGCAWDEACGAGFVVCSGDGECLPDGDGDGCPDSFVGDGQCDEPTKIRRVSARWALTLLTVPIDPTLLRKRRQPHSGRVRLPGTASG